MTSCSRQQMFLAPSLMRGDEATRLPLKSLFHMRNVHTRPQEMRAIVINNQYSKTNQLGAALDLRFLTYGPHVHSCALFNLAVHMACKLFLREGASISFQQIISGAWYALCVDCVQHLCGQLHDELVDFRLRQSQHACTPLLVHACRLKFPLLDTSFPMKSFSLSKPATMASWSRRIAASQWVLFGRPLGKVGHANRRFGTEELNSRGCGSASARQCTGVMLASQPRYVFSYSFG